MAYRPATTIALADSPRVIAFPRRRRRFGDGRATHAGGPSERIDAIIRRIHDAYAALSTPSERASYDARFGKPDR